MNDDIENFIIKIMPKLSFYELLDAVRILNNDDILTKMEEDIKKVRDGK